MKPLALLVAFLALAAPASASWQPADSLSAPNSSNSQPDVAVNARGDSAAVWVRKSGPSVQVSTRAAGGAWLAPDTLPSGAVLGAPHVALDGTGHANVVWAAEAGVKQPVWAAVTSPGGGSAPSTSPTAGLAATP